MRMLKASSHYVPQVPARRIKHSGFALLELLLTIAVLATIAGLIVPSLESHLRQIEKQRIISQTRKALLQMRQSAIDNGKPTSWNMNAQEVQPNGARLMMEPSTFTFLPDGTAQDTRITFMVADTEIGSLQIIGATGAIIFDSERAL